MYSTMDAERDKIPYEGEDGVYISLEEIRDILEDLASIPLK